MLQAILGWIKGCLFKSTSAGTGIILHFTAETCMGEHPSTSQPTGRSVRCCGCWSLLAVRWTWWTGGEGLRSMLWSALSPQASTRKTCAIRCVLVQWSWLLKVVLVALCQLVQDCACLGFLWHLQTCMRTHLHSLPPPFFFFKQHYYFFVLGFAAALFCFFFFLLLILVKHYCNVFYMQS